MRTNKSAWGWENWFTKRFKMSSQQRFPPIGFLNWGKSIINLLEAFSIRVQGNDLQTIEGTVKRFQNIISGLQGKNSE